MSPRRTRWTTTVSQDTLSGIAAAQQQFYQAIASKAQQALGQQGSVAISPIQTGGLGFNYDYLVTNNTGSSMVRSTFSLLDSTVVNGSLPGTVALGDSFSGALGLLLQDMSWTLSTADQNAVSTATGRAASAQTTLLTEYEGIFGPITSAQMQAAKVATPLDYVIDYQVRRVWSGTDATGKPPLNLQAGSRNLEAELPFMPSSAAALLNPLLAYLNAMGSVWPLLNTRADAEYQRNSIIDNIQGPTTANGGITTWDPSTPNNLPLPAVGYTTSPTSDALVDALSAATSTSSLTIDFEARFSHTHQVTVHVKTEAEVVLPIDDFIFGEGSGGSKFNLFSFQGTGNECTISAVFGNPTLVHVTPEAYDQANSVGWYLAGMVSQAVANTGDASVTGYKFATKPAYDFAAGGDFGRFLALAASQNPTITVTYDQGEYSKFKKSFEEHSSWEVSFLGIPLAKMSQSYYTATSQTKDTRGGFSLVLTPPSQAGLAPYELFGYILGGSVVYPGNQPV
ncbi:MAG: hypothetical protein ACRDSR_24140 [Pseudonocardiaceae bacterium]